MGYHDCITKAELELRNVMRSLWEQHVEWTRMFIISTAGNLADVEAVTQRLLRNPMDFGAVLLCFYDQKTVQEFVRLFTAHLTIAAELVNAAKNNDPAGVADAQRRWFANGEELVTFLGQINPYFPEQMFRMMFREHLVLTEKEAVARLNGDFCTDIALYDQIEAHALEMADVMAESIIRQFPERFRKRHRNGYC